MTDSSKEIDFACVVKATKELQDVWKSVFNKFPFMAVDQKNEFKHQMTVELGLLPTPQYCHPIQRFCGSLDSSEIDTGKIIAHQAVRACMR